MGGLRRLSTTDYLKLGFFYLGGWHSEVLEIIKIVVKVKKKEMIDMRRRIW